jgi:hypothetical protein
MRLHNWKVSLILRTARILRRPVIVNGDDAIVVYWRSQSQRGSVILPRLDAIESEDVPTLQTVVSVPKAEESSVGKTRRKAPSPRHT